MQNTQLWISPLCHTWHLLSKYGRQGRFHSYPIGLVPMATL